jgi:hypothetical protein
VHDNHVLHDHYNDGPLFDDQLDEHHHVDVDHHDHRARCHHDDRAKHHDDSLRASVNQPAAEHGAPDDADPAVQHVAVDPGTPGLGRFDHHHDDAASSGHDGECR